MKTRQEIEKLKVEWLEDSSFDLWKAEGFEEHAEELKAYQEEVEREDEEDREERLRDYATELGIPENTKLAESLRFMEGRSLNRFSTIAFDLILHQRAMQEAFAQLGVNFDAILARKRKESEAEEEDYAN